MRIMPVMLGVKIDNVTKKEALKKVSEFLNARGQHAIFTPNPEMLVDAQKDEYFKTILNNGSLNICDGKGIQLFSKEKIERVPGADFMLEVCRLAAEQGSSVYLLGSGNDTAVNKTAQELQKLFPKLNIVGFDKGPIINNIKISKYHDISNTDSKPANEQLLARINAVEPEIIFVAFGHNKQEKWIHENLPKLHSVKVAMGVGGAFDYISGKVKRAPCWMRKIGLEWMYRLLAQPKRFNRILKATLEFSWMMIKKNFKDTI